ncbi:rhamnan synthesis F family protein [Legionella gresilensis]|uniref:rhamnan synthesis F family protein n=1 Tax=Legionella gresilensis TaxID=91823 RepID=UPI001041527D|nr:rhamnan synthesis F family protein [Legionella gresilensis]
MNSLLSRKSSLSNLDFNLKTYYSEHLSKAKQEELVYIINQAYDLSILSTELLHKSLNPLLSCYFDNVQANIVRPFQHLFANASILEIGARFGIVTRYLGESGADKVVALEESPKNAEIIKLRTRDLTNIEVKTERFEQFNSDIKFDVIILIGTLEQADKFISDDDPASALIEKAKSMLKPQGKLIIATENKLAFDPFTKSSIKKQRKLQTHTLSQLNKILREKGFLNREFYIPFPNYREPVFIFNENAFYNIKFDPVVLISSKTFQNRYLSANWNNLYEGIWASLVENGLAVSLANSFLILAHIEDNPSQPSTLGYYYNTQRAKPFCRETVFLNSHDIEIKSQLINSDLHPTLSGKKLLHFNFIKAEKYIKGKLLSLEFTNLISKDNWTFKDVGSFLKSYLNFVCSLSSCNKQQVVTNINSLLNGECFNLIPQNIVIDDEGKAHAINKEWIWKDKIPVGYVLFRCLLSLINSISKFGQVKHFNNGTKLEFFIKAYQAAGFNVKERDLNQYSEWEVKALNEIEEANYTTHDIWMPDTVLDFTPEENKINDLDNVILTYENEIQKLKSTLINYMGQIDSVFNSLSWRITQPLRSLKQRVCKIKVRKKQGPESLETAKVEYSDLNEHALLPVVTEENVQRVEQEDFNQIQDQQLNIEKFHKQFYLKANVDVANAGINPYLHYQLSGKREGRLGTPFLFVNGKHTLEANKETVLIVSHDASRTGAPILALNLCQELNKEFNIITLFFNSGSIAKDFVNHSNKVIEVKHLDKSAAFLGELIKYLKKDYDIKFCIANSIESHWIIKPLAEQFIPSILLVHEFYTYTLPRTKFINALFWANITIFPTKIVQENVKHPNLINIIKKTHILPQGKCQIPAEDNLSDQTSEAIKIAQLKELKKSSAFVVLGAGSVHYRKGVDLFIATAAEIKRLYPTYNINMIWAGGGYNAEADMSYSCYLAEQIKRSDLGNTFQIVGEVQDLEELYSVADVFFLSSRLDPLPNVAIDTMVKGIPLICFDKGSGIVEFLAEDEETRELIIPYVSVNEAANKIVQLFKSPEYYQLISEKIKLLAQTKFNFKQYTSQIINLVETQIKVTEQEILDCATLENSEDFVHDFYTDDDKKRTEAIRSYVRSWHQGVHQRKPAPGFNPIKYARDNNLYNTLFEPFAHYINAGKPEGPWQETLITPMSIQTKQNSLRCAIHIHAFYPELLLNILERLQKNRIRSDLFISIPETKIADISAVLSAYEGAYQIEIVPNRGRNFGPLLTEFATELQTYDIIGHFHTKKSLDLQDPHFTERWNNFIFENLIGGSHCMGEIILEQFAQNPELGLVFADDPHLLGWDKNKKFADHLAQQLKISTLPSGTFNFPVGSMFWARPKALKPLFDLKLTWNDYPDEPLPYDGSILHAIERLIPSVALSQGFCQAVTFVPGLTR